MLASAGWWIAIVQLTPASSRPYIGGSQNNSLWNLMFGYNGFGRLSGNENGSVTGGGSSPWGLTGLTRLFNADFGGQISWLLPAALVLLVAGLVVTWSRPRTDRTRAALLLWGGWLVVTAATFSFGKGIIHPYYSIAFGPALGAVIGVGAVTLWTRRTSFAHYALMATFAATVVWSYVLLDRTPTWHPWLRALLALDRLHRARRDDGVATARASLRGRGRRRSQWRSASIGPGAYTLGDRGDRAQRRDPLGRARRSRAVRAPGDSVGGFGPARSAQVGSGSRDSATATGSRDSATASGTATGSRGNGQFPRSGDRRARRSADRAAAARRRVPQRHRGERAR